MFPSHLKIYRKDRNARGGGTFVLVEKQIKSIALPFNDSSCEAVWYKIELKNVKRLAVRSFYRPPGISDTKPLEVLSDALSVLVYYHVILGGDFNLPDIDWSNKLPISRCKFSLYSTYDAMISENGLYRFANAPTRYAGSSSSTLDLVLCNNVTFVRSVYISAGICDREIFVCNINYDYVRLKKKTISIKVLYYGRGNFNGI